MRLSSVRVAITAGIAHENPESIGTNARPCRPDRAHHAVDHERGARQVAEILEQADEQEQQRDLRHEDDDVADAGDDAVHDQTGRAAPRA